MSIHAIEKAALEAGPALEEHYLQGAVLRSSAGYSKRANSLTVLSSHHGDASILIQQCEDFFASRNQPSIVRIPSYIDACRLDVSLDKLGYQKIDTTRVMSCQIGEIHDSPWEVKLVSMVEWLEKFYSLGKYFDHDKKIHGQLLAKTKGEHIPALMLNASGETICCGIAVVCGEFVGLFSIFTNSSYRQQNLATSLIGFLLSTAREKGAITAYLQVTEKNAAAINLYNKLGFSTSYKYWYRIKKVKPIVGLENESEFGMKLQRGSNEYN